MALKFKATQHTAKVGNRTYFVSAQVTRWIASVVTRDKAGKLSCEFIGAVSYASVALASAACNEYERGQKASASDVTQELTKVAV